ncbi:hypothetical protein L1987_27202 [Smallanthus sonchifolius]|uniref:Uncharacterized protein n=1 Tax=Smallanthus sonchifolius TaxID=185202 RepID=A0ACB9IBC6_9ASTR|nr:hypothetical protein L1987_27202 [Smallanthus sonchifolius]
MLIWRCRSWITSCFIRSSTTISRIQFIVEWKANICWPSSISLNSLTQLVCGSWHRRPAIIPDPPYQNPSASHPNPLSLKTPRET